MPAAGQTTVDFNNSFFDEMLNSAGVRALTRGAAEKALNIARANAPWIPELSRRAPSGGRAACAPHHLQGGRHRREDNAHRITDRQPRQGIEEGEIMSVISPDIEQWLCDYLRDRVYDVEGLQFDNRKPEAYRGDYPLVTIRDDSGSGDGLAQFDRSIGVNIYGWTRAHDKPCKDLARRIQALLMDDAIASAENSPVIAVDHSQCNGPYVVPENEPTAHST